MSLTLDKLETDASPIYRVMAPSPHISWPLLNQRVGTTVWIKHENHNPTGSFKIRGGLLHLHQLRLRHPSVTHVVTSTRGNHGQSIAMAAQMLGLDATIVVPHTNSAGKNRAMQAYGARLIAHGHDLVESAAYARQFALENNAMMVESFNTDLVNGVSTYSTEFLNALPYLDIVYVPIGMGSGICGMIQARDALKLKTRIVGVVAEQADAYAKSFETGRLCTTETAHTVADGLACRLPKPDALALMAQGVDRMVRVSEDAILHAIAVYYHDTHNLAEGASAAALAAVLQEAPALKGKQVGVIHTGGNVDACVLQQALACFQP